jgi:hypothetical protein
VRTASPATLVGRGARARRAAARQAVEGRPARSVRVHVVTAARRAAGGTTASVGRMPHRATSAGQGARSPPRTYPAPHGRPPTLARARTLLLPPAPRDPELAARWRSLPFERRRALALSAVRGGRRRPATDHGRRARPGPRRGPGRHRVAAAGRGAGARLVGADDGVGVRAQHLPDGRDPLAAGRPGARRPRVGAGRGGRATAGSVARPDRDPAGDPTTPSRSGGGPPAARQSATSSSRAPNTSRAAWSTR